MGPSALGNGRTDSVVLGSEQSSAFGWVRVERLAAVGRQLLGLPPTARRELAAAAAPAAPQVATPGAADSRPCQAIYDAAMAGTPLNFTSVETFCLNQVLAYATFVCPMLRHLDSPGPLLHK